MIRFTLLFMLCSLVACKDKQAEKDQALELGDAHLNNSGSIAAQPHFEKGLLLLHSFEYEDARASFIKAQETDPDFAMSYWGEAMTFNQPIWHRQQYEEGNAALEKLGADKEERLKQVPAGLERSLWESAEILFGEGDKPTRDSAYANYMKEMKSLYPENQEVAALYALSLLGAVQEGRDEEMYARSATIAQGILEENPNHPGALHYLIHSYDDPQHAHLALQAANSYSKIAPDAAHALHMPSHIYVAMGMWEQVVTSNIASYNASVKRMEAKELDNNARSYHAYHWLLYGLLQQGKKDEAREILLKMQEYTEESPSEGARAYLIRMKGNYLVETGDWNDKVVNGIDIQLEDLNIGFQAIDYFLKGMLAFNSKKKGQLQTIRDSLSRKIQFAEMNATNGGAPMCSGGGSYQQPTRIEVGQAKVAEKQLNALMASLEGSDRLAEQYMKEAVDLQDELDYNYGPPEIVYPAYEFYGDWLLEKGRAEEAKNQFERSLERGPGRRKAVNAIAGIGEKNIG